MSKHYVPPFRLGFGRPSGLGRLALKDVSLQVAPGELVAVIGPNGAGKSTLLRILAGILIPSAGTAQVNGLDVEKGRPRSRAQVGVALGEERGLSPRLTAWENLAFFASIYGMDRALTAKRIAELAERLEATALLGRWVRTLSTGERARLGLLRALLHAPKVLLLDEMTRSLDPGVAGRIRTQVAAEAARGAAVLFASHDLEEVRTLSSRVLVLEEGSVKALGTFEQVRAKAEEVFGR